MKLAQIALGLASVSRVLAWPAPENLKARSDEVHVAEPVLIDRRQLAAPPIRTTAAPMNPTATTRASTTTTRTTTPSTTPVRTTTTTRSTTSSTTTRSSSTTTRSSSVRTTSSTLSTAPSTSSSTSPSTSPSTTTTTTTTSTTLSTTPSTSPSTTTTSTTTSNAAQATQTINVTGLTYQNAMLQAHNVHRANHSEVALVWNQNLANIAASIASTCNYQHNTTTGGGGYGQNIGAGAAGNAAAGLINNLMYNGEINNYPLPYGNNNPDMSNFGGWGHYSQLVWSDTTSVGCATVYCPQGLKNTGSGVPPYFTVCNYSPPGNYIGQFAKVKAPQGGATVVVIGS